MPEELTQTVEAEDTADQTAVADAPTSDEDLLNAQAAFASYMGDDSADELAVGDGEASSDGTEGDPNPGADSDASPTATAETQADVLAEIGEDILSDAAAFGVDRSVIEELAKTNPDAARKVAKTVSDARRDISRRYGEQQQAAEKAKRDAANQKRYEQLKAEFGEEKAKLIMGESAESGKPDDAQPSQVEIQQRQQKFLADLQTEAESTFGTLDHASEFYGEGPTRADMPREQLERRQKAFAAAVGLMQTKVAPNMADAMRMAHRALAHDLYLDKAKADLRQSLQRRSKQQSISENGRRATPGSSGRQFGDIEVTNEEYAAAQEAVNGYFGR